MKLESGKTYQVTLTLSGENDTLVNVEGSATLGSATFTGTLGPATQEKDAEGNVLSTTNFKGSYSKTFLITGDDSEPTLSVTGSGFTATAIVVEV